MLGMENAARVAANFEHRPADPQRSATCLKCHGTAADVLPEFVAEQLHIEDGVQCERCHGPGEKYAIEQVMKDKKLAMSLGLQMPTEQFCLACHQKKPSHEVLKKKPWDYAGAIQKIPCKDSGQSGDSSRK
jgi:hypothetical protein